MTDTPGWAPPSSSEPPREDARPPADAPATVPGQSSPHDTTPSAPPAWGGGYGGPQPGGPQYGGPHHGGQQQWGAGPGAPYGGPQPWGPQPWGAAPLSPKPGIIPLRPLGVGEILDGAVSTVRRHWRTALGISLGLAVVQQVVSTAVQWWSYDHPSDVVTAVAAVAELPVGVLVGVLATALLTMLVSRAILGRSVTLGEVWKDARPRLLQLLGLTLLNALIVLGIILLGAAPVIGYLLAADPDPGIALLLGVVAFLGFVVAGWVWIQLSLSAPALMLEKQGIRTSLSRSRRLVRGSWWRIFGITLLSTVMVGFFSGIIAMPFSIAAVAVAGDSIDQSGQSTGIPGFGAVFPPAALLVMALGGLIAGTITIPVTAAVNVLLYVDQRIRREALDIELARAAGLPEYGGGWAGADPADPTAPRL
ncbi:hypothetical protein [Kitasatospora sp. NBC_00315]|uniref:DUF7847 domain-containing protein n=1 Tax=Kitasatospora sp. NBC_00315 TaxID=2975963 RepID=UPI0032514685